MPQRALAPGLVEAVELHVREVKAPWPDGLIVERLDKSDPNPYYRMTLETQPRESTRRTDFGGDDFNFVSKKGIRSGSQPVYWIVLDSYWDPDYCYLWIEIMSLGEKNVRRGWVKDPASKLRRANLTSKG